MKNIILIFLLAFLFVGCEKEEKNVVKPNPISQTTSTVEVFLDDDVIAAAKSLRDGPDTLLALTNMVRDNALVVNDSIKREITAFNTWKVQNVILTPIGYQTILLQGVFLRKSNYVINFKPGYGPPETGRAYTEYFGDSVHTHIPLHANNVLFAFAAPSMQWTRTNTRDTEKGIHPFHTNVVYHWLFTRERRDNTGTYIFIEEVYLAPNNRAPHFNIPLKFN